MRTIRRIGLLSMVSVNAGATFNLVNRCSYVVWPAIYTSTGSVTGSTTPFGISPNSSNSVDLPSVWNGRLWGRTGCTFNSSDIFVCENGNCEGNSLQCQIDGTSLPVTLTEFSLGASNNLSLYDISLVGGFNLPLTISPSPKSASKNSSDMNCGSPSCIADVFAYCPAKLRVSDNGSILACASACNVFHTDQYCCTGNSSSPSACTPNNYTKVFKNLCPTAYSYVFDDASSAFACSDADFTITFCSGDNLQSATPPLSPGPAIALSPTPGIGSPISGSIPPSHALPPDSGRSRHSIRPVLIAGICTGVIVIMGVIFVRLIWTRRNGRKNEGEPNVLEIGPRRFKYKELYSATKGFNPSELLGQGGQGQVYKGILRRGGLQVAIKKLAPENGGRGMRDLVSELRIISELRHRNLVQLQGWCKHKGELLVVYDYMPKGSLDKLLFANNKFLIDWHVRYRIICGLGTALLYLHEEGEKRVVHRDVKPSNVMLDANFEPKLGDFGLARVIDRDVTPRSTTAAGTIGYTAPEIDTSRVPTIESDVFSFGIVALEVACGRKSFLVDSESGFFFLLQKVRDLNKQGRLMETVDPRLAAGGFDVDEMKRLFFVGLAATDSDPAKRPTMRQVLAILTKQAPALTLEEVDNCLGTIRE